MNIYNKNYTFSISYKFYTLKIDCIRPFKAVSKIVLIKRT